MSKTTIIRCVPPYDFDLSMSLFSDGDKQIRRFEEGKFWQIVRIDRNLFLLTLKAIGTIDEPKVAIDLSSTQNVSAEEEKKCRELSSRLMNVNFDLGPLLFGCEERRDTDRNHAGTPRTQSSEHSHCF